MPFLNIHHTKEEKAKSKAALNKYTIIELRTHRGVCLIVLVSVRTGFSQRKNESEGEELQCKGSKKWKFRRCVQLIESLSST